MKLFDRMCLVAFMAMNLVARVAAQEPKSAAAAIAGMKRAMMVGEKATPLATAKVITDSVRLYGKEFTCHPYKEVTRCIIADNEPRVIFRVNWPDKDLTRVHEEIDSMWVEMVTLRNRVTRDSSLALGQSSVQYLMRYVGGRWVLGRRGVVSIN